MSAPTARSPLGVTIFHRESTYGDSYERHFERARRAFYKWVCKNELFGNLRPFLRQYLYNPEIKFVVYDRERTKYDYGSSYMMGYPRYEASRSVARDQWSNEIKKHIEAANDARWKAREYRDRAVDRIYSVDHKPTRRFFRLMHAASAIAQQ